METRQSKWRDKMELAGRCVQCGNPRGESTSLICCEPCLRKGRDRKRAAKRRRGG